MEVVSLRKLAYKSVLNFGKHADRSINQIIQLDKGYSYLIWMYYNCDRISFIDEILDIVIPVEHRIEKPSKDPEKGKIVMMEYYRNEKEKMEKAIRDDKDYTLYHDALSRKKNKRYNILLKDRARKKTKEYLMNRNRKYRNRK
jgi:hypothetical protein